MEDNNVSNFYTSIYTKHYKSLILNTKKLKFNNKIFIGFQIQDLPDYIENVDFNYKGLAFVNKKELKKNTLQFI